MERVRNALKGGSRPTSEWASASRGPAAGTGNKDPEVIVVLGRSKSDAVIKLRNEIDAVNLNLNSFSILNHSAISAGPLGNNRGTDQLGHQRARYMLEQVRMLMDKLASAAEVDAVAAAVSVSPGGGQRAAAAANPATTALSDFFSDRWVGSGQHSRRSPSPDEPATAPRLQDQGTTSACMNSSWKGSDLLLPWYPSAK